MTEPKESPLAAAPAVQRSNMVAGEGKRAQLLRYLDQTLSRLESPPPAIVFKEKVLPSVVSSIERLTSGAPQTFQQQIAAILKESGVTNVSCAGLSAFKGALQRIKQLLCEADPVGDSPVVAA